ncbi:MAG: hypothetical protein ACRD3C_24820 [Vicinamibacterales bacterium]
MTLLPPSLGYAAETTAVAETEPLAITVRVRDTARVPEDVLAEAQGDVTQIYRQAGVDVTWATPESLCAESHAVRRATLTVAILSSEQAARIRKGVMSDRAGFTARGDAAEGGRVAYVLYDRIDMLAEPNEWNQARMLAVVMAHEIGHLLLPYDAHSPHGLMRADWSIADLQLAQRTLSLFTATQSNLLRSRVLALRGEPKHKSFC